MEGTTEKGRRRAGGPRDARPGGELRARAARPASGHGHGRALDGSIYPLLNRLQKEGKIRGRWVEDPEATHPRKYYALTAAGRALLSEMLAEWAQFESGMRQILGEEVGREQE
jgi:DNA-binding PadR family transcriptional regulator